MLNLKEYRDKAQSLADLLNIAFLVDNWTTDAGKMAVALQKDGSLLVGFRYDGPDLESLGTHDLESLSSLWNNGIARMGTDWGVHVTASRSLRNASMLAAMRRSNPASSPESLRSASMPRMAYSVASAAMDIRRFAPSVRSRSA